MIGQKISHYKILEKSREVPIRLDLAIPTRREKLSPIVGLSIPPKDGAWRTGPPSVGGSGRYVL